MSARFGSALGCAFVVFSLFAVEAVASPGDQKITYQVHAVRDQTSSPVVYSVIVDLVYETTVDKSNRWQVSVLTISHYNSSQAVDEKWQIANPTVGTGDGKWWTGHEDPDNPTIDEFLVPPPIAGTAGRILGSGGDMDFDLAGMVNSGSSPHPYTARMNILLQRTDAEDPDVDDEAEEEDAVEG